MNFRAIVIEKTDSGSQAAYRTLDESELMDGDVDIRVTHSTVNYKDGLAISGKSPVVRRFPMIPGVDLAGVVDASRSAAFQPGQSVVLNGFGVGEAHYGGFSERARVRSDWLVPLPDGLTRAQAMAIGTAGVTAMLCVLALETFGLKPSDGPVIVTGAAGGVGSVAVAVLAKLGWRVLASTGRPEEADYLHKLGATEIVSRAELSEVGKPLQKERWAAGVDTVGSRTLANLLAQTRYGGAIAATGLAGGMDLPATVAPFILRNVALLGVDSVQCPMLKRLAAWSRLASDLNLDTLAAMTTMIPFDQAFDAAIAITHGKLRGRVVVEIA